MTTSELERVLKAWRAGDPAPLSGACKLSVADALAHRDSGNIPDAAGRVLRLVLFVADSDALASIERRRLRYEPDFHAAPSWRRPGSKPVNVVPLRSPGLRGKDAPWWEDGDVGALEDEWQRTGRVAGLEVPGGYRSFVYKTVLSLREAGEEVTARSVADSVARWLEPRDASKLRRALGAGE